MEVDVGVAIADAREARGHRAQGELFRPAVVELVQESGAETRPSGLGRTEYALATVRSFAFWVVVEEHALPLLLPPVAGGQGGRAPLHLAGQGQRRPADLIEDPAAMDAHDDVDAARTRGLGPAHEAEVGQDLVDDARDLADLRPLHAGHGIEVDTQLVGMVEVVRTHGVRVELEGSPGWPSRPARPRLGAPPPPPSSGGEAQGYDPRSIPAAAAGARFW